jgi:hypothetical protein
VSDMFGPLQCATWLAPRQRPLPDAEIVCGKVSF